MSKKQTRSALGATAAAIASAVPETKVVDQTTATAPNTFTQVATPETASTITMEGALKMTTEELLKAFGNKSNAIRGMAALGIKTGPIAKQLGIRYQHARNVLSRPLKRVIKEERDAAKQQGEEQGQSTDNVVGADNQEPVAEAA